MKSLEKKLVSIDFFTRVNFDDTQILNVLSPCMTSILEICKFLSAKENFISEIKANDVDKSVAKEMNTAFRDIYQPMKTPPDGNCLWHMVSISLCGDKSLTYVLRALTTFTIIILKDFFFEKIKFEFVQSYSTSSSSEKEMQIYVNNEYNDILNHARLDKSFGNQYHLFSICTFLQRNIYIYDAFTNNCVHYSAKKLKNLFDLGNTNLGRHVKYIPNNNIMFSQHNVKSSALFGFLLHAHYTSLIPKEKDPLQFVPKNGWFN
jgi:hypothetical protein